MGGNGGAAAADVFAMRAESVATAVRAVVVKASEEIRECRGGQQSRSMSGVMHCWLIRYVSCFLAAFGFLASGLDASWFRG